MHMIVVGRPEMPFERTVRRRHIVAVYDAEINTAYEAT